MRATMSPSLLLTVAITVLLAFAFLGTRSIWDPDEGRYTNVALNMLESGDWLHPMRNEHIGHWTKPPLTYWVVGASIGAFGYNPWAARLPVALAYLACVWAVWRIARRWLPGEENRAALIYATMFLPFGAAQMITTDFLLSAALSVAMMGWIESRYDDPQRSRRWVLLMWAAFGVAFMTKGPPALLPLLVVVACIRLLPAPRAASVFHWSGLLVFIAVAMPWYAIVVHRTPGLLDYFLGRELVARVATSDFGRHGEWYGWLEIYLPTLVLGSLPWTVSLWRWLRSLGASLRSWKSAQTRSEDSVGLILFLWVLIPLVVFCLARSRLPLYLLPLFTPLALIVARQIHRDDRGFPSMRWIGVWVLLLVGLRLASAFWSTHKDAAEWAEAIRARVPYPVTEVAFVEDMARYGVHLHLQARVDKLSLRPIKLDPFDGEYDTDLDTELADLDTDIVFICKQTHWDEIRRNIEARGRTVTVYGSPYQDRILFGVSLPNS
ncbi:ArnT family glycosyltransferase [Dokdonella immobilis]|uniref:Dolichyl-phosphate-mannose-protein mannosyltransferase n=1 Tax=Dokdonella immobilis TaxID=578942 RepID=A0A1I5AEE1_9GAMM|nr:glycosyltransferase family 39 protein [Dokdonella immobilis]SFN60750.1 Dolichyl-phosphate-mannose-protein mannosyltransferase [Dokdonella immobilis]